METLKTFDYNSYRIALRDNGKFYVALSGEKELVYSELTEAQEACERHDVRNVAINGLRMLERERETAEKIERWRGEHGAEDDTRVIEGRL